MRRKIESHAPIGVFESHQKKKIGTVVAVASLGYKDPHNGFNEKTHRNINCWKKWDKTTYIN